MKRKSRSAKGSGDAGADTDKAARLYISGPLVGAWMEPTLPDGSRSLFRAGVGGSHSGQIVCVGRFTTSGPLESCSVGILSVVNSGAGWPEQGLRLSFLNRAGKSISLNEARYRIISEWVTVFDVARGKPLRTGGFSPPPDGEVPQYDQWLSMTKEDIVRSAAGLATPPEVFAKYPELIIQNPILSQIAMTNFWAFRRWIYLQPKILQRLAAAGRLVEVPGGSPLSQMVATEWVNRGKAFKRWYDRVIEPLCPSSPVVIN